jgi:FtsK/SpoIIIE family
VTSTSTTSVPGPHIVQGVAHTVRYVYHHQELIGIPTAITILTAAYVWWRIDRWTRRRRDDQAAWSAPVGRVIRGDITVKKVSRKRGRIVYMRLRYGPEAIAYGPGVDNLEANMTAQLGFPVTVGIVKERRLIHLRRKVTIETVDDPSGRVARAQDVARRLLGDQAQVESARLNPAGKFDSFAVTHATIHDAKPEFRKDVDTTIQAKLGQRFQSQWEQHRDRVIYRAAATLPTHVPHPAPVAGSGVSLPFAVDANDNHLAWNLDGRTPHALFAGPTGGGKSNALRTVILEATYRGIEVRICDGKQVSLLGLEDWPSVTRLALTTPDISQTIVDAHVEMERRKQAVRERRVKSKDLPRLIVVIDELWVVLQNLEEAHKAAGLKGIPPAVLAFRSLAREGRELRLHLLVGIQRPDAEITKGETRSNFGCRLIVGDSDVEIRRMMKLEKVTISAAVEGRGVTNAGVTDKLERECQVYWTPDPDDYDTMSADDRAIIDGLRPGHVPPLFHVTPPQPVEPELAPILRPHFTVITDKPETPAPPEMRYCRGCETEHPVTNFGNSGSRCKEFERKRAAANRAAAKRVPVRNGEGR